jgi:DNA-binding NarL/FixJ family response regulator
LVFVITTTGAEEDRARAYNMNVAGYVLKHRPGQSFLEAISMLEHYWRVIEFPD